VERAGVRPAFADPAPAGDPPPRAARRSGPALLRP
jgi:hypothetical protein